MSMPGVGVWRTTVDGLLAVNAVGDAQNQPAGAQGAAGIADAPAHQVGHADFAPVDRDAHGGDGAEECGRGQNEGKQDHSTDPFEPFAKVHGS